VSAAATASQTLVSTAVALRNSNFKQRAVPTALAVGDMWIDTGSTNLLTYSEQVDNGAWEKYNGWSVATDTHAAPDGTVTADTITTSGTSQTRHYIDGVVSGSTYTFSAWLLWISGATTLSVDAADGPSEVITLPATMTRVAVTLVAGGSGSFFDMGDGGAGSFVIWGTQLEAGSGAGRYIPTVATSVSTVGDNTLLSWSGTEWEVSDNVQLAENTAAVQTEATTRATQTGELYAQYTVKVDINGYVSGFGLASTLIDDTPYSEFAIVADAFTIAPVNTDNEAADGSPFFYRTSSTVINGVTIPAGAYMKSAYIHDASITNAKIANLAVDSAKVADAAIVEAKIGTAAVTTAKIQDAAITTAKIGTAQIGTAHIIDATITEAKIGTAAVTTAKIQDAAITTAKIGTAQIGTAHIIDATITEAKIADAAITNAKIGNVIQSVDYVSGSAGWKIDKAGQMEMNNATFRGALSAATGTFSGTLTADAINAVDTINLAGQAVTIPVSAFTAGAAAVGGTYTEIQSAVLVSTGEKVVVITQAINPALDYQLTRDGTTLVTDCSGVAPMYLDTPPSAGTYTYKLWAKVDPSASNSVSNRLITLLEVKR
jgi:hypothetical protein